MLIEERHQKILDWLEEKGYISTDDIQEEFGISYDSAKRDRNPVLRFFGPALSGSAGRTADAVC